ncbi:MAG: transposase [Candidatus Riflebacteria bacterium]|nr:transposase [Candidatus Riflebacteria bacterium]
MPRRGICSIRFDGPRFARNIRIELIRGDGPSLPTAHRGVVNCKHTGFGEKALEYLSRYLYRGTINEKRIFELEGGKVGFTYIESKTKQRKKRILSGEDFLWLLVQHVLPKGFRRARDFGFLHGNAYRTLSLLQLLLNVKTEPRPEAIRPAFHCPDCKAEMKIIACRVFRRGVSENQLSP